MTCALLLQEVSSHVSELVDGVYRVYTDESRAQLAFGPPGTATDFFTDMHWCVSRSCWHPSLCSIGMGSIPLACLGCFHMFEQ